MLGESKNTRLIMWMNYLLSKSDQVIEALAKKDSIFQKVLDAERNFRVHSVNETLNSKVNSLENKNALLESEKAALNIKVDSLENENASLKQEMQQTEARAKLEEALKNAKNMLAKGLPRSLVKEITELSDNQLAALS